MAAHGDWASIERRTLRLIDVDAFESAVRPASVVGGLALVAVGALLGVPALLGASVVGPAVVALHLWGDLVRPLVVSGDGVEIADPGRTRFFAWSRIASVTWTERVLILDFRDAAPRRFARVEPEGPWVVTSARPVRLGNLGTEIAEIVARYRLAAERPPALEAELTAHGRSADVWLAAATSVETGETYRTRVRREEILGVVVASTDPTARLAAALALRRLEPTGAERETVASVARRLADRDLAGALGLAIDGDLAAAERAARRLHRRRTR